MCKTEYDITLCLENLTDVTQQLGYCRKNSNRREVEDMEFPKIRLSWLGGWPKLKLFKII